jgi:hypothetical protein
MSSTSLKKSLGGSSSPSLSRSSNKGQRHSHGLLAKSKGTSTLLTGSEFYVEFTLCMREKYASSNWSIVGGFNKFQDRKRIFERYINWFYKEYGNHMIPGHLSHRKCASGSNFTKHGLADKTSDICTRCRLGLEAKKIYFLKDVINKIF